MWCLEKSLTQVGASQWVLVEVKSEKRDDHLVALCETQKVRYGIETESFM